MGLIFYTILFLTTAVLELKFNSVEVISVI